MIKAAELEMADIHVALKAALRRLPGPVALITTTDPETGEPAGLAASAVIPVSMEPPSMLVSVNRSASAHAAIGRAGRFCINIVGAEQTVLVGLFSNSQMRASRFVTDGWADCDGLPYLPASPASICCAVRTRLEYGTHELFIGDVVDVRGSPLVEPLGWFEGAFAKMARFNKIG